MNQKAKTKAINTIHETVCTLFEAQGFVFKRNHVFEKEDSVGNTLQYVIDVAIRPGYLSLHLKLNVLNKQLLKKVNGILEKALKDPSYSYPDNWDSRFVASTIKLRLQNRFLAGVTDWRIFREDGESLEEFNSKFSMWFCNFYCIEEISDWHRQLLRSVDFSTQWFASVAQDDDWIIANTVYPALYLLKQRGKMDDLHDKFTTVLSNEMHHKEEVNLFFMMHLIAPT